MRNEEELIRAAQILFNAYESGKYEKIYCSTTHRGKTFGMCFFPEMEEDNYSFAERLMNELKKK
jgi:hypothetical protein